MILLTNREQFTNAIKKARQVKPIVTMVEFGVYVVWGSTTNYTVEFGKVNGQFGATCTCPAQTKGTPKACYHLFGALAAHTIQVGIRQQVRAYKALEVPSVANWTINDKEAA